VKEEDQKMRMQEKKQAHYRLGLDSTEDIFDPDAGKEDSEWWRTYQNSYPGIIRDGSFNYWRAKTCYISDPTQEPGLRFYKCLPYLTTSDTCYASYISYLLW